MTFVRREWHWVENKQRWILVPGFPTITEAVAKCREVEETEARGVEPAKLFDGAFSVFARELKIAGAWVSHDPYTRTGAEQRP